MGLFFHKTKKKSDDGMQNGVYCDNERLRDYILDAKPSPGGLYPHELAMIFYASIGQIQYENPGFAGVFHYQLKVDYPVCLLYSLIERGYLRKSRFEENIDFFSTREMQQFVKEHGAKSSAKHAVLAETIRSNFSEKEIRSKFPQDYYVPTEKGREELDATNYTIMDAYKGWEENKGFAGLLKISDVTIRCPQITEISINTSEEKWVYSLMIDGYPSVIGARIVHLPKRSNLKVSVDGRKRFIVNDVDIIRILRRRKILIFESIKKESEHILEVIAIGYSIDEQKPLYTETINDYGVERGYISLPEFIEENTKSHNNSIRNGNQIDFYASVNDQIAYLLLKEYLAKLKDKIQVVELNNHFHDDPTQNIKISVLATDNDTRNLIHYLVSQRLLLPPAVFGISFSDIAVHFYYSRAINESTSATRKLYFEDHLDLRPNCDSLMEKIATYKGGLSTFESYFWRFPSQVYHSDIYRYYDSSNGYHNDKNWEYVKSHEYLLRSKYNKYLLDMKEMGLIPTRWVNELNLYFSIRSYFPDAIYQYRCDWLGLQSLDIFIPSKQVGIEYQGKQHYEAVDFFGGNQGLEDTKARDARKRQLCKENHVRLLTWDYNVEVQSDTVYDFLIDSRIALPEDLKRKEITTPIGKKTRQVETQRQRAHGKIYQYDKQFSVIGTYDTVVEASQKTGVGKTSINKALYGERLLAGECFWYRGEEPLKAIPNNWKERLEKK